MKSITLVLAVALVSLVVPSLTRADDTRALARQHFERGKKMFDLQRFPESVKEYEAAYELHPSPELLFDIAQAARNAGDYQKALGAYRMFLSRATEVTASEREMIQARIDELKRLADEQRKTQEKPPTGMMTPKETPHEAPPPAVVTPPKPVAPPPPPIDRARLEHDITNGRNLEIAGGVTAGVGVLALAVLSPVFATVARSADDTLNHPKAGTVWSPSLESKVTTFQNAEVAMIATGAALLVGGVTMVAVGHRRARQARIELAPAVGKHTASLSLVGSF